MTVWPLPCGGARDPWGGDTCQEHAGPALTGLHGLSPGQVCLSLRETWVRAWDPGAPQDLVRQPSYHRHLNQPCPRGDGVLPPGGSQQHRRLLQGPAWRQLPPTALPHRVHTLACACTPVSEGVPRESGWLVAGLRAPLRPPSQTACLGSLAQAWLLVWALKGV